MSTRWRKYADLTAKQKQYVDQSAKKIFLQIIKKGDSFYSYGEFHCWWDGPKYKSPRKATPRCGLVDLDNLEDVRLALHSKGYLFSIERRLWKVIAEEVRNYGQGWCLEMIHDQVVDLDIAKTRGKRMKRITAYNYLIDRLYYKKVKGV